MAKLIDITGQKFGRLKVLSRDLTAKTREASWKCQCDCGNIKTVKGVNLRKGVTTSCGCFHKEMVGDLFRTHGESQGSRFYSIWQNMKRRCDYEFGEFYHRYGGRGIKVCERWLDYQSFKEDMFDKYVKHVLIYGEKDTTIDRINTDGDYSPNNCKWSTNLEQQSNSSINRKFIGKYIIQGPSFGYIEESSNQNEFARKYNLSSRGINACLTNKIKTHKGWEFQYI